MLGTTYDTQVCSIARALEVVGERWTLLVLRDVLLGLRRFDEIQDDLGIARNVLQTRLTRLVEHGLVERRAYQERPVRHEYVPTPKGRDLGPALVMLMHWGDRHAPAQDGPPTALEHRGCGGTVGFEMTCDRCGALVPFAETRSIVGPGAPDGHPLHRARERRAAPRP